MFQIPRDSKIQDMNDPPKSATKCKIPQRLPVMKPKTLPYKPKPVPEARPKSANRIDSYSRTPYLAPRSARPERHQLKRPVMTVKKMMNEVKSGKPVITIPLTVNSQKQTKQPSYFSELPDQETITKNEDMEFLSGLMDVTSLPPGEDSPACRDYITHDINWQHCTAQFEAMKKDLGERQKALMEFYANMTQAHQQLIAMGKHAILPSSEDLTIMNVAKLTPDQLLQLCDVRQDAKQNEGVTSVIDINKLYALPSKMIATCEETLGKRKDIIDWFVTLKTEAKPISIHSLEMKINEFRSENEMLRSSLEHAKGDFIKELNEIIQFMRKTVNEAVSLQIRTEEQTYELSELNSLNNDLRKQLHNIEILRSNKSKLEELEKELKEEKCKKNLLRDRLSRAEGQIKLGTERVTQLEAALEQAHSKTKTLEQSIQQLQDQKRNVQADFDKEVNRLTKSIQDNAMRLEEMTEARERLQTEKEDFEKHIQQLSKYHNDLLKSLQQDLNVNTAKLEETEKKYLKEVEEKKSLVFKLEAITKQSREQENYNKELLIQIQEKEKQLCKASDNEKEMQNTKRDLHLKLSDIEDYKSRLVKQSETIKLLKCDLEDSINSTENLKSSLTKKEDLITELEKKRSLLEEQLKESENKMNLYEKQLESLRNHINQLQQDFGQFENLTELHDMINQQRVELLEATKQNNELVQALKKKEMEVEHNLENLAAQEQLLEQKEDLITMLSEKEGEQTKILKLLRNNLEIRTQGDMDLSQQIYQKNSEIKSLVSHLDTRKQQISQLEKIILTLEEQSRKCSLQRKRDQDKICSLEKQIAEISAYHLDHENVAIPANNIDNIIKMFEEELGSSFEKQLTSKSDEYILPQKKHIRDKRKDIENLDNVLSQKENIKQRRYETEHRAVPTKIVLGNFVKKTYISNNDDQCKVENLDRKKAITNIDTQKWMIPDPTLKIYTAQESVKDRDYARGTLPDRPFLQNKFFMPRNLPFLNIDQLRDEKNNKMFRFAGHRL